MEKDEERQSCRKAVLALILLSVLAWLPGFFTLPPLDRDESRFAQASKQMLETGDFVDIKLGEANRYEKPVGIYWLQAASTSVLGLGTRDAIWTYRVPSFLGALAAVLATFHIARLFAGNEAGLAAGAVLALSVLLMAEAKIAKTDAVLAGTVAVAQWAVMRAYLDARGGVAASSLRTALFGWAAFGLGVLVKGPLIALVCGLSVVAVSIWDRDASWLKRLYPLRGLLVALAIVLPWLIAIGIASDGAFFRQSLGQDFGGKVMGDAEAHGAPPGYFAVLMFATFWPGSLALLPALFLAFRRNKEPAFRYLLCWAVTTWLMFEMVPTKLPHYVLPAYPALAVLCGVWLTEVGARPSLWSRVAAFGSLAAFVGVGLALAAFFVLAPERLGDGSPWWLYAEALAAAVMIGVAFLVADRRMKGVAAALAALILYELGGYETVPRLQSLWLSPRLAAAVERHAQTGDPPVITAGYAEPSATFLLGTGTRLLLGDEAGKAAAQGGGLAAVEQGERSAFLESLASAGARAGAVEEIEGLNYSRGREARITLYRVTRDAR